MENYPCKWNGPGTIRGAALVVNYEFLGERNQRKGSDNDMLRITKALKGLGYQVCEYNNLSYKETEEVINSFIKNEIHGLETTDSTVVVIMSHGDAGNEFTGSVFQTEDNKPMASQPVVDRFQYLRALEGKPKLFFFNFCRGPLPEENLSEKLLEQMAQQYHGKETRFWFDKEAVKNTIPPNKADRLYNDTIIVYSTLPRFASFRSPETGSFFLQALCDILEDQNQIAQKDIVSVLNEVDQILKTDAIERKEYPDLQYETVTPETLIRGFNKKFYLASFHKLRNFYLDKICKVAPLPWYPSYNWSVEEIYTELVIVHADESEESIPVKDLFKRAQDHFPHGSGYRILIEGDPGYGKSTLVLKLASDWSRFSSESCRSQTRLVLLAKLSEVEKDGDLENHIWEMYGDKIEIASRSDVFKGELANQVLVLLDGYDEASEETKKTVWKVMDSKVWSQCHVVLTSRFCYVTNANKTNALCTVLKGFQKKNVAMAVGRFFIKAGHLTKEQVVENTLGYTTVEDFKDVQARKTLLPEASRLGIEQFKEFMQKVLDTIPYKDLAPCPLLCSMLCCLTGEFPNRQLPDSVSGLYFAIINRNLHRAAAKIAAAVGEDPDECDWDELQSTFYEDHQKYLYEFGLLCHEYIASKASHFTHSQLTGNKKRSKPNDPCVTRLLEAGVIVKGASSSLNAVYHPVHRTMAEFLAAFYLTNEEDQRIVEHYLLKLCSADTSFMEICTSCFEMGSGKIVVDVFREIKLPENALHYLRRNLALDTDTFLQEISPALPCQLSLHTHDKYVYQIAKCHRNLSIPLLGEGRNQFVWFTETVENIMELMKMGFHLHFVLDNGVAIEKPSSLYESLPDISFHYNFNSNTLSYARHVSLWLQRLVDQKIQPHAIDMFIFKPLREECMYLGSDNTSDDKLTEEEPEFLEKDSNTSDDEITEEQDQECLTACRKELIEGPRMILQSSCCPESMTFHFEVFEDILALCEVLQDPPDNCLLKSLHFINQFPTADTEPLLDILTKYWLPKRLVTLDIRLRNRNNYKTIVNGLDTFQNLTCLRLSRVHWRPNDEFLVTCIRKSGLQELELSDGFLFLSTAQLKKCTAIAGSRLRRLRLFRMRIRLRDPAAFDLDSRSFVLDTLEFGECDITPKLLNWLALSCENLRSLTFEIKDQLDIQIVSQTLELFASKNANTLEVLHLLSYDTPSQEKYMSLQRSLQPMISRYQRLEDVTMRSISNGFASFLVSSTDEPTIIKAMHEILALPHLKVYGLPPYDENTFNELADLAYKWPGQDGLRPGETESTLTLKGLMSNQAAAMTTLFRERGLDFRLKNVGIRTYEISFPPKFRM